MIAIITRQRRPAVSAWVHVAQAAAALAAAMGVGRFGYTPILPLMTARAGLTAEAGANLATANYVGYLAGALAGILAPPLVRSPAVARGSLVLVVATLAGMPFTHSVTVWLVLRLLAGIASAAVFVIAVSSLLSHLRDHPPHLSGWALGGVGAGIALSGLLVLILHPIADWRAAWWSSAALAAVLAVPAWHLRLEPPADAAPTAPASTHRWFAALFASYTLEGVGYIIAGTFLVAAIEQNSPGWTCCSWHSSYRPLASRCPPCSAAYSRRCSPPCCSGRRSSVSPRSLSPLAPTCGSPGPSRC